MSTLKRVFDIAGKISMQRKKPRQLSEKTVARGEIVPQDVLKAMICAENREKLDIKGIAFANISIQLLGLTGWSMNAEGIYNSRCFFSLMTKEKLLILITQLNKIDDIQERRKCLQKYIVEHIHESLSKLVTMCCYLYNIKDSKVFDEKKTKWQQYIKENWKGDYFQHKPSKYFYKTIIPELVHIGENNKGPMLPAQAEHKQDNKSSFLSKFNLTSTYSRLSLLLSCSAVVLCYKWFFADKGGS